MRDPCAFCGAADCPHLFDEAKRAATVGPVYACDDCARWARVVLDAAADDLCPFCGDQTDGKYSVYEHGQLGAGSDVCSDCRYTLMQRDHPLVDTRGGDGR